MIKRKAKMNCRDCRDGIDDYLEENLGKTDEVAFEVHLSECPECMKLVQLQKLADRIITEEKKIEPDFYLAGKIMAKIENPEKRNDTWTIRILRPALATIAIAAAITGGVLIGSFSGETAGTRAPIELTLMDDAGIELINMLASE